MRKKTSEIIVLKNYEIINNNRKSKSLAQDLNYKRPFLSENSRGRSTVTHSQNKDAIVQTHRRENELFLLPLICFIWPWQDQ